MNDVESLGPDTDTMRKLDAAKRVTPEGVHFWMARELSPILGYPVFQNFEAVIQRASDALAAAGKTPSQQIMLTHKQMGSGQTAKDYYLSRAASYLIAMNGEPSKPEVAAAQLYFAAKTRQMEVQEAQSEDVKRLELREKVKGSVRRVSSAAQDAGVRSKRQGIFHEQRWRGLYDASSAQVKSAKGLQDGENIFDRAGPLELAAHDFQMELAASALVNERIRGEQAAFQKNLEIAKHVRSTIKENGGTLPEYLPLEEHITEVRKRVSGRKTRALPRPKVPAA